jgi:hypothetical protein
VNVFGLLGIIFKLLSQLPNIDTQILGIAQVTPELGQQEFMGEDLAGMLHEHAQ